MRRNKNKSSILLICVFMMVQAAITAGMGGCSGCESSATQGDGDDVDGDSSTDPSADRDGLDSQRDSDGTPVDGSGDSGLDGHEDDVSPPPYVPGCGNGVLDEGEECDDRNRLNGDGCDWVCRLGNGDPPPDPDPNVSNYVPDGDPIVVFEEPVFSSSYERLPLVWTGSEFATSFCATPEGGTPTIDFRRFSEAGEPISSDWTYPTVTYCFGTDLVWTGSGFGLFYTEPTTGIYFEALSANGKPIGSPILVEPDPQARGPAADLTPDGFILAWETEGDEGAVWSLCSGGGVFENDTVRIRKVGRGGETEGDAVMIEEHAGNAPDIVTGEGGFGMNVVVAGYEDWVNCAPKFVKVSEDLSTVVKSGYLSNGVGGDVVFADGRYITAWSHYNDAPDSIPEFCFGRFMMDGLLERPPVCNLAEDYVFTEPAPLRLAAGDGGLALLDAANSYQILFFLRTDFAGRAVAPSQQVTGISFLYFGGYGIAWADDGFGILFNADRQIYFQRYRLAD